MRDRSPYLLPVLLLLGAALATSCENTDLTAPTDGQLIVNASPKSIVIDRLAGEESGQSTILAQVYDAKGFALDGAVVTFITTGGTLASADNSCAASSCRITGDACTENSDCPTVSPQPKKTDSSGAVTDVLTLGLADPASVDVTVISGAQSGSVTVNKTIAEGNIPPTAVVTASPEDAQAVDLPVTFDGRGSSDPDGAITCYQWVINATVAASKKVVQGQAASLIDETYAAEQVLTVQLWVSDEPQSSEWCPSYDGPPGDASIAPQSRFSADSDLLRYEILCDTSDPVVDAGSNQTLTLDGNNQASADLSGRASDNESGITSERWSCGNGQSANESEITCTYTSAGDYTATFSATNGCGMTAQDTVAIKVLPKTTP